MLLKNDEGWLLRLSFHFVCDTDTDTDKYLYLATVSRRSYSSVYMSFIHIGTYVSLYSLWCGQQC